ncbi:MAG: hypothetical protein A4E72_01685 [Syntrophus sp. PtaU1.Bin208]|nr:MAG: hypothetical protein A4E72_01685 [Syntrophus sp. PtaU1.Bin208]
MYEKARGSEMNIARNWNLSGSKLIILCFILFLSGCMVASTLKGKPGLDVSSIRPGISMNEVNKVIGPPKSQWKTPLGITYCVYKYDGGVPPNKADAMAFAFMDIISLGMWEIVFTFQTFPEHRVSDQMAVSYDGNDLVIEVFDHFGDFDELPANGSK